MKSIEESFENKLSFTFKHRDVTEIINEEEAEEEETEELSNSPLSLIRNFTSPGSLLNRSIPPIEEKQILNTGKKFKSDEFVICLTNQPNVLFCNCGHLCLCSECDKTKSLTKCPICKTENEIKRMVE